MKATTLNRVQPADFTIVMATGIIAVVAAPVAPVVGRWLLWVAVAAAGVLVALLVARALLQPHDLLSRLRAPATAFEPFALVAAAAVLGDGLAGEGYAQAALVLGSISAAVWVVLTYVIPSVVLFGAADRVGGADGTWLLWPVATQGVAGLAGDLAPHASPHQAAFAMVAAAGWGLGVVQYVVVMAVLIVRWLRHPVNPSGFTPAYWVAMGATEISALAGVRVLALSAHLAVAHEVRPLVSGVTLVLWALGTWWIPLLLVFGLWRHVVRRVPLVWERALWSLVFPLGMYVTASLAYGASAHLSLVAEAGAALRGPALGAWLVVTMAWLWHGGVLARARLGASPQAAEAHD